MPKIKFLPLFLILVSISARSQKKQAALAVAKPMNSRGLRMIGSNIRNYSVMKPNSNPDLVGQAFINRYMIPISQLAWMSVWG